MYIRALVTEGMFSNERVVRIKTTSEIVHLFVQDHNIKDDSVRVICLEEDELHFLVQIMTSHGFETLKVSKDLCCI